MADNDDDRLKLTSSGPAEWRGLYERAMLETDGSQVSDRIEQAESAIIQRSRQLALLRQFNSEDVELTEAILSLGDLRRKLRAKSAA